MKKVYLFIFLFLFACVTSQELKEPVVTKEEVQEESDSVVTEDKEDSFDSQNQIKPIITVLDFEIDGISESEMKSFISFLSSRLFQTGKYTVIDVNERNTILKEIEFSRSDCTDESCQLEIGKLLSAEMIVVGSIRKIGSRYVVAVKMLDVQTGRMESTADGMYDTLDSMLDSVSYLAGRLSGKEIPKYEETPSVTEKTLLDMVLVEGGTFSMGSTTGESDEKPVHSVTVSSFYISRYEVTFKQYDLFCEETGREKPDDNGWGRGDMPVIYVSWYDAVEFCNYLSEKEGLEPCYRIFKDRKDPGNKNEYDNIKWLVVCDFDANGYRLPTEAEWEYASRGGNKSKGYIYSGSNNPGDVGWYYDNADGTMPVGLKQPNELGLYDMSGNVWEWCWDWYGVYDGTTQTDPLGPAPGSFRVLRGGCWYDDSGYMRCADRVYNDPDLSFYYIGFRPVRTK